MQKLALLIGVSEYEPGFPALPSAIKDVEAMQRVLEHPEMGNFNQVKPLLNPDPKTMSEEIETLFSGRKREDLVVLFFSGHGILDDKNKLHFSTRNTRKSPDGNIIKTSMVSAHFVQEQMGNSRCQQIVILDCCYSGAIADGLPLKGDSDVGNQLSGDGRAVLTSSTAAEYSLAGKQNGELSVYTQYVVEGIETGEGDEDEDGQISALDLHNYAKHQVRLATDNAMQPKIYSIGEGFNIIIAETQEKDPGEIYRDEIERLYQKGKLTLIGKFRSCDRKVLQALRCSLNLSIEQTTRIEQEVLVAHQERQQKLRLFWQIAKPILAGKEPVTQDTRRTLIRLQRILKLRLEEIDPVLAQLLNPALCPPIPVPNQAEQPVRSRRKWMRRGLVGLGTILSLGIFSQPLSLYRLLTPTTEFLNHSYHHVADGQLLASLVSEPTPMLPAETVWRVLDQLKLATDSTQKASQPIRHSLTYEQMQERVTRWQQAADNWATLVQRMRQHYITTTDSENIGTLQEFIQQQHRAEQEWQDAQKLLAAMEPAHQAMQQQGTARGKQDWQAIANQWRSASKRMSQIQSGPYAGQAQSKVAIYQQNATVAGRQANRQK
jgi:hypothetical protein